MKKVLAISALATTVLFAQDNSYRIFLTSFTKEDSQSKINSTIEKYKKTKN